VSTMVTWETTAYHRTTTGSAECNCMKNLRYTLCVQAPGGTISKLRKPIYLALLFHADDYTNFIMAAVRLNRPVEAGLFACRLPRLCCAWRYLGVQCADTGNPHSVRLCPSRFFGQMAGRWRAVASCGGCILLPCLALSCTPFVRSSTWVCSAAAACR
jgi:hypothetical protein